MKVSDYNRHIHLVVHKGENNAIALLVLVVLPKV